MLNNGVQTFHDLPIGTAFAFVSVREGIYGGFVKAGVDSYTSGSGFGAPIHCAVPTEPVFSLADLEAHGWRRAGVRWVKNR